MNTAGVIRRDEEREKVLEIVEPMASSPPHSDHDPTSTAMYKAIIAIKSATPS